MTFLKTLNRYRKGRSIRIFKKNENDDRSSLAAHRIHNLCIACKAEIDTNNIKKNFKQLKNQEITTNSNQKYLICDTCYDRKLKLLNYCGYTPPNGTVEYRINKWLSVKLLSVEDDQLWEIIVAGKVLDKNTYIIYNANPSIILNLKNVTSVDRYIITRPVIFGNNIRFEHVCEILWLWNYFDYNTRLLDSYASFPLLRALYLAGDPKALRVFKKEIVRNLKGKPPGAVNFLVEHDYIDYIDKDKLENLEGSSYWGQAIIKARKLKKFKSNYSLATQNEDLVAKLNKYSISQRELDSSFAEYANLSPPDYTGLIFELLCDVNPSNVTEWLIKLSYKHILAIFYKLIDELKKKQR